MGVTKLFRKRTRFRRAGGICGDQNEPWGTLYGDLWKEPTQQQYKESFGMI